MEGKPPLPLTRGARPPDLLPGTRYDAGAFTLPTALSARLRAVARRERVTLNTLIQAAWSILLGRYTGSRDVVFGAVTSGRPPELAGAETIVGLLINTVPVRVRL